MLHYWLSIQTKLGIVGIETCKVFSLAKVDIEIRCQTLEAY